MENIATQFKQDVIRHWNQWPYIFNTQATVYKIRTLI